MALPFLVLSALVASFTSVGANEPSQQSGSSDGSSSTTPRPTASPSPVGSSAPYQMIAAVQFHLFIDGIGRDQMLGSHAASFGSILRNFAMELGIGLRDYRDVPLKSLILALGERNLDSSTASTTVFVGEDSPLNSDIAALQQQQQGQEGQAQPAGTSSVSDSGSSSSSVNGITTGSDSGSDSSNSTESGVGSRQLIFDPNHPVNSAANVQLLLSVQYQVIPSTAEPPGYTDSGTYLVGVVSDVKNKLSHAQDLAYNATAEVILPVLEHTTSLIHELASSLWPSWANSTSGGRTLNLHIDQHSVTYSPPQLYLRRSLASSPHPPGWTASATPTQWTGVDLGKSSPSPSLWRGNNPFGGGGDGGTSNAKGLSGGQVAGVALGSIAGIALLVGLVVIAMVQALRRSRKGHNNAGRAGVSGLAGSASEGRAVAHRRPSPSAGSAVAATSTTAVNAASGAPNGSGDAVVATGVDPMLSPNASSSSSALRSRAATPGHALHQQQSQQHSSSSLAT